MCIIALILKINNVEKLGIKNCTYYFLNDMINIKNLDPKKIKIDRNSYKNIFIYNIVYALTNSVKPLHLIINKMNDYNKEIIT